MARRLPFIERVLDAAYNHGASSEPDHEVGDLQEVARCLWATLTPKQRHIFAKREDMNDLIITWVDQNPEHEDGYDQDK